MKRPVQPKKAGPLGAAGSEASWLSGQGWPGLEALAIHSHSPPRDATRTPSASRATPRTSTPRPAPPHPPRCPGRRSQCMRWARLVAGWAPRRIVLGLGASRASPGRAVPSGPRAPHIKLPARPRAPPSGMASAASARSRVSGIRGRRGVCSRRRRGPSTSRCPRAKTVHLLKDPRTSRGAQPQATRTSKQMELCSFVATHRLVYGDDGLGPPWPHSVPRRKGTAAGWPTPESAGVAQALPLAAW